MRYNLKNDSVSLVFDTEGAELKSAVKNGREYMWYADPKIWGRTSPILFPFVGAMKNGEYTVDGEKYHLPQHGFARDMEFEIESETENSVVFALKSDEETKKSYPFDFVLKVTYTLEGDKLTVAWTVENPSDRLMYFSIGGHPGFMCPFDGGKQSDYKLHFDCDGSLEYSLVSKSGFIDKSEPKHTLALDGGYADITEGMFDKDALIAEDFQAHEISLCMPDGTPYVTVLTDAPLFGIWSKEYANAPYICIEPWYGRCDAVDSGLELSERDYICTAEPHGEFTAKYEIIFRL